MIVVPTAKTLDHFPVTESDAMKPTMAARITDGPKLFAGAIVYIMTDKNMNASATDLFVWLVPSTLVTGTVKRLDISVTTIRTTSGANPLQPRSGRRRVATNPNSNMIAPTATTAASSDRFFQLNFGMNFTDDFAGGLEFARRIRTIKRGLQSQHIGQHR